MKMLVYGVKWRRRKIRTLVLHSVALSGTFVSPLINKPIVCLSAPECYRGVRAR